MHKIRLAFRLGDDDRFVVMAQSWPQSSSALATLATETTYDDEDLFLKLVIYAELDDELTRRLVIAIILSVAEPKRPSAWVAAEISTNQNEVLGLNLPPKPPRREPLQSVASFTLCAEAEEALS